MSGILRKHEGAIIEISDFLTQLTKELMDREQKILKAIPDPVQGERGEPGQSIVGPKGERGDNYVLTEFDKMEIADLINVPVVDRIVEKKEVIREIPIVKEIAQAVDIQDLLTRIKELPEFKKLVATRTVKKGGGDIVEAGSGVTIVRSAGKKVISVSSVASAISVPTGTVNGSNQTFVFTSAPTIVFVDGIPRQKTENNGFENWTGATTIILTIAPTISIFGIA